MTKEEFNKKVDKIFEDLYKTIDEFFEENN